MQEKYQVLARKYRPQKFSDVIGQDSVVTTLKNALKFQKIAHAYLFSGSRGIGKTTLARLFAMALNCPNRKENFEPCGECNSCQEIASSSSLDVIEIDGASNRGIDDIRQINETIGYRSSSSLYKIYIIDEVHMLTKEAFNALLKTLEEPPNMSLFFFATTEAHKVLPTILSRCQRFDLKKIPHALIVQKLQAILQDLNRVAEMEALHLIAEFSDGALRDAESLLDQMLCFEEKMITEEIVRSNLGFVSQKEFFELDHAIDEQNYLYAFELAHRLDESGKDISFFLEELIEHFRKLLAIHNHFPIQNLSNETLKLYESSSKLYTIEQLLWILDLLFQASTKSGYKRLHLEIFLMQILRSKNRITLPSLIYRLTELEKKLAPTFAKNSLPITPSNKEISKEILPLSSEKPLQETPVQAPPLSLSDSKNEISQNNISEPAASPLKETPPDHTLSIKQETLMRFAAIELEGQLKKE